MTTKKINPNQERKTTPKKYKVAKDNRSEQDAGQYPHYFSWKTRSGNVFQMDDSKGQETVTLQHRSGSAIQMRADGSVHFTTHNGKYEVVFGEDRITVSGAQDITVKGDASMRVYGDYNVTCHKDYNLTVMGDLNITAKNKNQTIRGNKDTMMKNETKKIEGTSFKMARGSITTVSKGQHTIGSQEAKVYMGAATGIHSRVDDGDHTMEVTKGDMYMETKKGKFDGKFSDGENEVKLLAEAGKLDQTADKDIKVESKQQSIKVKAMQNVGVESTSGGITNQAQQNVQIKSTSGDIQASAAGGNVEMTAQSKMDLRATGDASFSGSTTHVSGQSVNVKGAAQTNIDGPSGLNLNTGLSMLMNALGLQMNFDFGEVTSALGVPNINGAQAEEPQEEQDLTSEIDNWV
jgi:uncharacterized protein YaiE (UPF0345 family)